MNTANLEKIIDKGCKKYEEFKQAKEAMEELKALEGNAKETEKRLAELKKEEGTLQAARDAAVQDIVESKAAASAEAKKILSKADGESAKLLADTRVAAKIMKDNVQDKLADLAEKSANLEKSNAEAAEKLDAAQKELADVQSALAAGKAEIAKFLKG